MDLNLDEYAAARAEAGFESKTVTFHGQSFTLPPEMPLSVAELWEADKGVSGLKELFNGQWESFAALDPTVPDLKQLILGVNELYGLSEGKSGASGDTSAKSGGRSRRTSNASTDST